MSEPQKVLGWTLIRGKRELKRFEKENHISYRCEPAAYPCLARAEIAADENSQTEILRDTELVEMLTLIVRARLGL